MESDRSLGWLGKAWESDFLLGGEDSPALEAGDVRIADLADEMKVAVAARTRLQPEHGPNPWGLPPVRRQLRHVPVVSKSRASRRPSHRLHLLPDREGPVARQPRGLPVRTRIARYPSFGLSCCIVDRGEALTWAGIDSVRSDGTGGPVAQSVARDGSIVESQIFPTKYPHVVIERVDRYGTDNVQPLDITWSLRRVQNQRAQTQVNRVLDVLGVALDFVGLVR